MKFNFVKPRFLLISILSGVGLIPHLSASPAFEWTTDHMQVGVRWQPSVSRPLNNTYELTRPILAEHSSYVMFWVAWSQIEPSANHCDYKKNPSSGLRMFDHVVSAANEKGLFVEFVFLGFQVGRLKKDQMEESVLSQITSVLL